MRAVFVLAMLLFAAPLPAEVEIREGKYLFGEKELESIIMESPSLRVVVVPERGGRVVEITDKIAGRENYLPQYDHDSLNRKKN